MQALGMLEVYSFTNAVCTADIAAKAADVRIIAFDRNRPIREDVPAPLVMQVKIEGGVAAVQAAVEAGKTYAKDKGNYIVSHVIPRPAPDLDPMAYLLDVNRDKYNKKLPKSFLNVTPEEPERIEAIGLLEIQGLVAAISGLDAMVKAADVRLVHTEKRLGGRLVTLVIAGGVSAVSAALEAGTVAANALGKVYGCEAIPNPHPEILKYFDMSSES